jgi:hypothetical protein
MVGWWASDSIREAKEAPSIQGLKTPEIGQDPLQRTKLVDWPVRTVQQAEAFEDVVSGEGVRVNLGKTVGVESVE